MLQNKTHAGASQFGTQGLGAGGGTILPEKGAFAIKWPPAGILRVRSLNLEANCKWGVFLLIIPWQLASKDFSCFAPFFTLQRNSRRDPASDLFGKKVEEGLRW